MLPYYVLTGLTIIVGLPGAIFHVLRLIERGNKKRNDENNNRTMPS